MGDGNNRRIKVVRLFADAVEDLQTQHHQKKTNTGDRNVLGQGHVVINGNITFIIKDKRRDSNNLNWRYLYYKKIYTLANAKGMSMTEIISYAEAYLEEPIASLTQLSDNALRTLYKDLKG